MEDFILRFVTSKLHSGWSLLLGLLLELTTFAVIDGLLEKIIDSVNIRFLIYLLFFLVWILYWLHYRFKFPKNKKGKVGCVIAIYAENTNEERLLKADFIDQLQKSISQQGFEKVIEVIPLKNHLSEKIINVNVLKKFHKKIKGHFYLYGKIKKRMDGEEKYFLELDGMVIHRPVDIKTHSDIVKDFVAVLPKQISFFESIQLKGFQVTASIVYLAVKYVTGLAALLSGDPYLAIKLHQNLREEFNSFKPLPVHLQKIRDKVNLLLSKEEYLIAQFHYNKNDIPKTETWLSKSLATNPKNYEALLLKSMKEFEVDKNPRRALRTTQAAKKEAGPTNEWCYNEAFLNFWLEDYPEAIKSCERIARSAYPNETSTIEQVEKFNLRLLQDQSINNPQLYFWLGFINYKKKRNLPSALKYFEQFERKFAESVPLLQNKSSSYIREIKKEIGIR